MCSEFSSQSIAFQTLVYLLLRLEISGSSESTILALVIYCYVTNYLQTQQLEETTHYLTIPWARNPGTITWLPLFQFLMRSIQAQSRGCCPIWRFGWSGRSTSKLAYVVFSKLWSLTMWTYHEAATWRGSWPPLEWVIWDSDRNWARQKPVCPLTSEIGSHHFYCRSESVSPAHTQKEEITQEFE